MCVVRRGCAYAGGARRSRFASLTASSPRADALKLSLANRLVVSRTTGERRSIALANRVDGDPIPHRALINDIGRNDDFALRSVGQTNGHRAIEVVPGHEQSDTYDPRFNVRRLVRHRSVSDPASEGQKPANEHYKCHFAEQFFATSLQGFFGARGPLPGPAPPGPPPGPRRPGPPRGKRRSVGARRSWTGTRSIGRDCCISALGPTA